MQHISLGSKTDNRLIEQLEQAARRPVTKLEIREQRVSFVFGSISSDAGSLTREQVRKLIEEQEGVA